MICLVETLHPLIGVFDMQRLYKRYSIFSSSQNIFIICRLDFLDKILSKKPVIYQAFFIFYAHEKSSGGILSDTRFGMCDMGYVIHAVGVI
jgi:hypothetical protein